jgi:hypothetical protein
MHQQLWGYKVDDRIYLEVRERKRLNMTVLGYRVQGYRRKKNDKFAADADCLRDKAPVTPAVFRDTIKCTVVCHVFAVYT